MLILIAADKTEQGRSPLRFKIAAIVAPVLLACFFFTGCGDSQDAPATTSGDATQATSSQPAGTPLRDLAGSQDFQIGAAALAPPHEMRNPAYSQLLSGQFSRLVLEDFSWDLQRPSREGYNFFASDRNVEFGLRNSMTIEGHHLAWGAYDHLPAWLKDGNFTRDELITILHEHVNTVVTRYKGRVDTWMVANEVVERSGLQNADFWGERIGPEYVGMVFTWAREADPDATLVLNQGATEDRSNPVRQQITDGTYELLSQLKQQGAPVDGIGMQMHIMSPLAGDDLKPPARQDVVANMQRFAQLGLDVYVSEFDVNMSNVPGTHDERMAFEAGVYREMLQACLDSGVCRSFSTFGFTDAITWYNDCPGCLNLPNAEPLPFDRSYQPKPAYYALQEVLAGGIGNETRQEAAE